ncbi:MAG TPA: hypothetical protein VF696_02305 [Candidatus Paceibacterota bacterium]|jgi:aspartate kinase
MSHTVLKIGGSSLSSAERFKQAAKVIRQDPKRNIVVVSAPGKRHPGDEKVTDLLLSIAEAGGAPEALLSVTIRFKELLQELQLLELEPVVTETLEEAGRVASSPDEISLAFAASRGEYLSARILAALTGMSFVDATELIRFKEDGTYDELATRLRFAERRIEEPTIIPGYYGLDTHGRIRTFARGGSDISGAIVAAMTGAALYENGTDVSGVYRFNPRMVDKPASIPHMTYPLMREFAYRGAGVFQWDAVLPLYKANIPTRIFDMGAPDEPGTMIYPANDERGALTEPILGVAERTQFAVFSLHRVGLNADDTFTLQVLQVLRAFGLGYEHITTGIDTLSIAIREDELGERRPQLAQKLADTCRADVSCRSDVAIVCVIGSDIGRETFFLGALWQALAAESIEPLFFELGASRTTLIIGIQRSCLKRALTTLASLK